MNDNASRQQTPDQIEALKATFARLDPLGLAVASGVVCGLLLLLATLALLVAGSPTGIHVGGHLDLLSHLLPGYEVSRVGALIGLLYGFFIGGVLGLLMAAIWNVTHFFYAVGIAARSLFERNMAWGNSDDNVQI